MLRAMINGRFRRYVRRLGMLRAKINVDRVFNSPGVPPSVVRPVFFRVLIIAAPEKGKADE